MNRNRVFVGAVGIIAVLLGVVIVGRGLLAHSSALYDIIGVLFIGLGAARLYELRRGGR